VKHFFALAMLCVAAIMASAEAQAQRGWIQAGVLTCRLHPSVGFIVGGHQTMGCVFAPSGPFPRQFYVGALNTVGLDIGVTAGGVLAWTVFAHTAGPPRGALAGDYVGATGDIGLGVGAGANFLVGGSNRSVALQPLSVQGSVSVKIAVGASVLRLRAR